MTYIIRYMNLGRETETIEFKKTTAEKEKAMCNISSMLNEHGYGTLYFGVSPDGEVTGQEVSSETLNDVTKKIAETIRPVIYPNVQEVFIEGKSVIKVEFCGEEKPYSTNGRYYKRVHDRTEEMTPTELRAVFSSSDVGSVWEDHLTSFGSEAVDHDTLSRFYQKAIACGRIEELVNYDEVSLLTGLGVFRDGYLTNAGYYLFSKQNPIILKAAVYVTDERINFSDISRFTGNIYSLIEKSFQYIKEHINWRIESVNGTARVEVPEVPIDAVREILVNSFAHADYRGVTEHEIDITPTIIEIYNPGEFPENLTPEMFVSKHIKSMPRNKVILNVLYKSKDVEIFGSGFRKTYALCNVSGTKCSYDSSYGGFSFSFQRQNGTRNVLLREEQSLNNTEKSVLSVLKINPYETRAQIATGLGKSVRTVQRSIDRLVSIGMIKRVGSDKKGFWLVLHTHQDT